MAITDKTRKLLWGRSGNRCALCKCDLVMDGSTTDDQSVVGDECHIIAKSPNGPRYQSAYKNTIDDYSNLILLCKTHHKLIDDQSQIYTADKLWSMKERHEEWVRDTLGVAVNRQKDQESKTGTKEKRSLQIRRVLESRQVLRLVGSAYAYDFDYDPLRTEHEVDLVGGFLQNLQDWADLWSELEAASRVQVEFSLTREIEELERDGFAIFAALDQRTMVTKHGETEWPVAVVRVLRFDNPIIVGVQGKS